MTAPLFPVRLLLLEDRPADAELAIAHLTAGGFVCTWTRVQTEEALRRGLDEPLDAVLADYGLPGFSGLAALAIVRERQPDLPFILVSGTIGEDQAVAAIKNGADDYLLKDRLSRLAPALEHALVQRRLRIEASRASAEVAAQKRLLQSVVESMADGVLVADERGTLQFVNPAARRIMGDALIAKAPGDWQPEHGLIDARTGRVLSAEDTPLLRAMKGLSTEAAEILIKRPGMETRVVSSIGRPILDAAGKVRGGVSTWRDITSERRAQAALRRNEERYRDLFWNDLVGHFVSTPEGRLLACNPSFVAMFGFQSVEDALQADLNRIYQQPQDRERFLSLIRDQKELRHYETENVTAGGRVIRTIENTIGRFDEQGNLSEIHGSVIDVTELREAERHIHHSQKMEAVGQLAAGVARDFNDLLTVILGYAERLLAEAPASDECRLHLGEIVDAVKRGSGLTHQLLSLGGRQTLSPQVLDLNDVIRDAEPTLRRLLGERVTLTFDLSPEGSGVTADAGSLLQVITNLVENAHDAIPATGSVHIQTGVETRDADGAQVNLPGLGLTFAVLTVTDTGLGMDEATRAQIFEPFFTTKPTGRGTGLGLSVVHGIVKQGGGSIDVESTVGEGTVFRIRFPAAQVDARRQEPRSVAQQSEGTGGHETILITENEPSIRQLILTTLELNGYTVLAAVDGAEALTILERPQLTIDLIVTDLLMPHLDSVGLGQRLAVHHPRARVLYTSGGPGVIDRHGPYLAKPFGMQDLLVKVREILDAPSA